MFFAPSVFVRTGHPFARSAVPARFWNHSDFDRAWDAQQASVESDDNTITLTLDVPGLSKEQLTIGIEGRMLRIRAKDDAPRSFKAAYKIGSDVDASKSEAKLENGVLTLKFAKVAPESRETLLTIN
ncbi:MAG: Hsp20/alpha crystallin family protein [Brachymonas sp.]